MMTTPTVIERVARVAPLGVRFWDELARTVIGDGLIVTAYRPGNPDRRFALVLNRANTYVLQNVPGLRELEFGAGDPAYWDALPAAQEFVIEVMDAEGRFIPFSLRADAPQRDRLEWLCGSPPQRSGAVPLISSPTRRLPGGYGVIRAELRDQARFDARAKKYAPAAWAMLEAWYDGQRIGRGIADEQGRLVLAFPYPEPINPPLTSPPSGPRKRLTSQQWPIELRAFYSPLSLVLKIPDLCAALTQTPAQLHGNLSPPAVLAQVDVAYGVERIVKTVGLSELLISA
jgi:hypothetical protein